MEQVLRITKKKKDRKPIFLLAGFLVFFGVFIAWMIKTPPLTKAINKIGMCTNADEVKSIFEQHKFEFRETNDQGQSETSPDFVKAAKDKLASFHLSDEEVEACFSWLPRGKKNLNVIIIPDLSRRIIDSLNNPHQRENDLLILDTLWGAFKKESRFKQNSKDRFVVDVTDIDQAKGQFGEVANKLRYDMSTWTKKSNRLYFTADKDQAFKESVKQMYSSALDKPLGADYLFYFRRYLPARIMKPTLYDDYINKVVIITDGYLEAEGRIPETKIASSYWKYDYRSVLYPAVQIGNVRDVITANQLNIPKINGLDLSKTDVLICEVSERRYVPFTTFPSDGKGKDFDILKEYWTDWLSRMGVPEGHVTFLSSDQASDQTGEKIEKFIKN